MSEVADKPAAAASAATAKPARILNPQRMGLAESLRQDWVVNAEEGTTPQEVMAPEYWAHMASQLQQFDHVEVRMETGEWIAQLVVVSTGRNWAQMHLAGLIELEKRNEAAVAAKHRVDWKGPQKKFSVIRSADQVAIQDGFASRVEADRWLANYERTTSA